MRNRIATKVVAAAAGISLVLGAAGATIASAAPATGETTHFSVLQEYGTPIDPATNTGCPAWAVNDFVYLNLTGNGVTHFTVNGAGDFWYTSTFTGTGSITFYTGDGIFNSDGDVVGVTGDPEMAVTGRLTQWFGFNDNRQNANQSGTVTFNGKIVGSGAAIKLHFHAHAVWSVGSDPNGPPDHLAFSVASCK